MAEQIGIIKLRGTFGNLTFYPWGRKHFVRLKSSLTRRRVKESPEFERSMQSSARMGRGSKLASKVYRAVKTKPNRPLFQRITGDATLLFKQGVTCEEAETILMNKYQEKAKRVVKKEMSIEKTTHRALQKAKEATGKMQYELQNDLWVLTTIRSCFRETMSEPVWVYN